MTTYVSVLPDGTEHFDEIPDTKQARRTFFTKSPEDIAKYVVRRSGKTTPRSVRADMLVKMFRLETENGELKRIPVGGFVIPMQLAEMTQEEHDQKLAEVVVDLPHEFRELVGDHAYDHGHSSGLEECISIAQDIAGKLAICVDKYKTRLTSELTLKPKPKRRTKK